MWLMCESRKISCSEPAAPSYTPQPTPCTPSPYFPGLGLDHRGKEKAQGQDPGVTAIALLGRKDISLSRETF